MQCIKCGRDIEEPNVFCDECLADMKKYPVRPGTVVQLPKYHEPVQKKQPVKRKPPVTLEDQLKLVRKWARMLAAALAVSILLLLGAGYLIVREYIGKSDKLLPGQNYSAATTTESNETAQ